ncbi:MAG: trimeric intracellular cation channel family protein [Hyphomicrobiales bacterium]
MVADLFTNPLILIAFMTYLASAVMAISAALQAVRYNLDPFGATVLACATAMGGGTARDLMLGNVPVFWIKDLGFLLTVVPVALVAFFVAKRLPSGSGQRNALLQYFDAVGLSLFTLIGVQVALEADVHWIVAIVLGCITGSMGGMIRDVLCGVKPSVLYEDLYATISLLGGAIYLVLVSPLGETSAAIISFVLMLSVRSVVVWRRKDLVQR